MKPEFFVSVDIETNGIIPGPFSMLSFAAAVFNEAGEMIGTFERNLNTLVGAGEDPDTMKWWKTQPEAWKLHRVNTVDPKIAMEDFAAWVKKFEGVPVMVAAPAGFDGMFLYWYFINFTGSSPFSFSCLDMRTYASAMLKKPYRQSSKRNWPARWFSQQAHTHVALDDAIEQGETFMNMRKENLR